MKIKQFGLNLNGKHSRLFDMVLWLWDVCMYLPLIYMMNCLRSLEYSCNKVDDGYTNSDYPKWTKCKKQMGDWNSIFDYRISRIVFVTFCRLVYSWVSSERPSNLDIFLGIWITHSKVIKWVWHFHLMKNSITSTYLSYLSFYRISFLGEFAF